MRVGLAEERSTNHRELEIYSGTRTGPLAAGLGCGSSRPVRRLCLDLPSMHLPLAQKPLGSWQLQELHWPWNGSRGGFWRGCRPEDGCLCGVGAPISDVPLIKPGVRGCSMSEGRSIESCVLGSAMWSVMQKGWGMCWKHA